MPTETHKGFPESLYKLYSLKTVRALASMGYSSDASAELERFNEGRNKSLTLGELMQKAYNYYVQPHANPREYEFINVLVRYLLESHIDQPPVIQIEQPVHNARVDVVAYYPTHGAHAYEIKTGRDSLDRLPHQIEAYSRTYRWVTVVTTREHVDEVSAVVPEHVGISVLDEWRDPANGETVIGIADITAASDTDALHMLHVDDITGNTRKWEPATALKILGGDPDTTGGQWSNNRDKLTAYPPSQVAEAMSNAIWQGREPSEHLKSLIQEAPPALTARLLKMEPNKIQTRRILGALNSPTGQAFSEEQK